MSHLENLEEKLGMRKDVSADSLEIGVKPIHSSTQALLTFQG